MGGVKEKVQEEEAQRRAKYCLDLIMRMTRILDEDFYEIGNVEYMSDGIVTRIKDREGNDYVVNVGIEDR